MYAISAQVLEVELALMSAFEETDGLTDRLVTVQQADSAAWGRLARVVARAVGFVEQQVLQCNNAHQRFA